MTPALTSLVSRHGTLVSLSFRTVVPNHKIMYVELRFSNLRVKSVKFQVMDEIWKSMGNEQPPNVSNFLLILTLSIGKVIEGISSL